MRFTSNLTALNQSVPSFSAHSFRFNGFRCGFKITRKMVYGLVCVYLIFLRITFILSKSDYNFYQIDGSLHNRKDLVLQLIKKYGTHTVQKRDQELENVTCHTLNFTELPNIAPTKKSYPKFGDEIFVPPPPPVSKRSVNTDQLQKSEFLETSLLKPYSGVYVCPSMQDLSDAGNSRSVIPYFYKAFYNTGPEVVDIYWVDLDSRRDVTVHTLLSNSNRISITIRLLFEFPFYGHLINNVTLSTGGFLYTGGYLHKWITATQYIAPLMANFDTSLSNDSFVKYFDNGTAFTAEWEKVSIHEYPDYGKFSFQVTIHKNGDIVFVYRDVPLSVLNITENHHPVKVGLSDAYVIDSTTFCKYTKNKEMFAVIRKKTVYEYHQLNILKTDVQNLTVFYLRALPTCLESSDCVTCVTMELNYKCMWCTSVKRCSSGVDRHLSEWISQGCRQQPILDKSMCFFVNKTETVTAEPDEALIRYLDWVKRQRKIGPAGIVTICLLIATASGFVIWIVYAYRNPHSISGQMLITYRPCHWRWRNHTVRYNAATATCDVAGTSQEYSSVQPAS